MKELQEISYIKKVIERYKTKCSKQTYEIFMSYVNDIENSLKALEIIKSKMFLAIFTSDNETNHYLNCEEKITPEQYELLKGVLR